MKRSRGLRRSEAEELNSGNNAFGGLFDPLGGIGARGSGARRDPVNRAVREAGFALKARFRAFAFVTEILRESHEKVIAYPI